MFDALYAQASPDGPEHFPEVWEKVRTMWADAVRLDGRGAADCRADPGHRR